LAGCGGSLTGGEAQKNAAGQEAAAELAFVVGLVAGMRGWNGVDELGD